MSFIRKKELDSYLSETLKTISQNIKENYEYFSRPKDIEDQKIRDDCLKAHQHLEKIRETVHCIDDLSLLDENDIDFVYQCLALYEGEFTISHKSFEQQKEDERNYRKLEKLLNLFY